LKPEDNGREMNEVKIIKNTGAKNMIKREKYYTDTVHSIGNYVM
jgi:hypothetical protein